MSEVNFLTLTRCSPSTSQRAVLGALQLAAWVAVRTLLISNLGTAEFWTGQLHSAQLHLAEAARADGFRTVALPALNAQAHLGYLHWMRGELVAAETTGRHAVDGFVRLGMPTAVQTRTAYLALAGVAIDRDDLAAAPRWLEAAYGSAGERHTEFATDLMAARLEAAKGRLFEAVEAIRDARQRHKTAPFPPSLVAQSELLEAEVLVLAGTRNGPREPADALDVPGDSVAAEDDSIRALVTRHLTTARRALAEDRRATALDELEAALAVAAPDRLRQPFVALASTLTSLLSTRIQLGTREPDFAADLHSRMSGQLPRASGDRHGVFVPLTAREANILRYLATTLTVKEIALAQYVSINTVKTHQRSIYHKLGAGDRREAVAHARKLGFL